MINKNNELLGVVPIVPTPFKENQDIDEGALRALVEFAVTNGLQAVCLPAYASEFYKLTDSEKLEVVRIAVDQSAGRIQIVSQSNSPSLRIALQLAQANVDSGADIVSIAVPRIFHLPDISIKQYLAGFLGSIPNTPVLIQDFNPGGTTMSVQLINELRLEFPNFKYLKLEEPLSAPKIKKIIKVTDGNVGVFEGWGGLYMLELIPAGIVGIMPGLAVADILQRVFTLRKNGAITEAFTLFERVMPQIFFSLQNMELYHYAEKELLMARKILKNSIARIPAYIPDPETINHIRHLNERICSLLEELSIPIR